VKDLYVENCKILMKETEEDTKNQKGILCSYIRRINTVKVIILPGAIYRVSALSIKISMTFFTGKENTILKFMWNHKR
jgi:hypothetical protein